MIRPWKKNQDHVAYDCGFFQVHVQKSSSPVTGPCYYGIDTPTREELIAPNMSMGVNVLAKIVAEVAAILPDFDAEVLEIHHRTKIDAPSGTAVALGKAIAAARGTDFGANAVYGREGITGVRPGGKIAVLAMRAGDAVGDHTVIFGGQGERLELIHRAQSRDSLARGAIRAAVWIATQKPGLYTMRDVLGL